MMATSTGTVLNPVELSAAPMAIAIAKPRGVAVSTAEAYAGVTPSENSPSLDSIITLPVGEWQRAGLKNDFETSVFAKAPATAALKRHFIDSGAVYAAMSGSGAAVFGLFDDIGAARAAAAAVSPDSDILVDIIKFS